MAMDRLEGLGVIKRDFRTVSYGDGLVSNNVMYIELIADKLFELTYPEEEPGKAGKGKAVLTLIPTTPRKAKWTLICVNFPLILTTPHFAILPKIS